MSEPPDATQASAIDRASKISDVIFALDGDTSHPLYRPDAARVLFEEFGLPCYDCEVAFHETVAEGLSYRGLDPTVVLARLNALPSAAPQAPAEDPPNQADGT